MNAEISIADVVRLQGMLHPDARYCLHTLRAVSLKFGVDLYLAGGAVRALVWDSIYGVGLSLPRDLDVAFYSKDPDLEEEIERALRAASPWLPWEVRNQARMHVYNGLEPFTSFCDSVAHWVETASAVAIRLPVTKELLDIQVVAPFGLGDLFGGVVRTPPGLEHLAPKVLERVHTKGWLKRWPDLTVHIHI